MYIYNFVVKKKNLLAAMFIQTKFRDFLKRVLGKSLKTVQAITCHEIEITVSAKYVYPTILFLSEHSLCSFKNLVDIAVYDLIGKKHRFVVVYNITSVLFAYRVRVFTKVRELDMLLSIVSIYTAAKWLEREVWDFFGLFIFLNGDLRRILTDYGFRGHPLRKDFPLTGFVEVFYDDYACRVVYKPIELAQEFRSFQLSN